MSKKLDWLKRHGGDVAVQTFSEQIEKMDSFAKATNLPFKENETVKNLLLDEDEEVTSEVANLLFDEPVAIEKEADVTEISEVIAVETAIENAEFVSVKEFQSVLDELVDNAITPLVKALAEQVELANELRNQVTDLAKQIEKVTEFQKSVNEPIEDVLSVIPSASAVSYLQNRLTSTMKSFVGISKAEDKLVERKPAENLYQQTKNDFALFLDGN